MIRAMECRDGTCYWHVEKPQVGNSPCVIPHVENMEHKWEPPPASSLLVGSYCSRSGTDVGLIRAPDMHWLQLAQPS